MGLFDRFRARNEESALPDNADEYYKEDRANRRMAALLLGVATFVATLAVGSAFYFGGRAVYRAISGDDNQEQVVQQENTNQTKQEKSGKASKGESGSDQTASGQDADETRNTQRNSGGNATPPLGDQALPATGDPGM